MSCCGEADISEPKTVPQRQLPYKHLFKYIIVGDTGIKASMIVDFLLNRESRWKVLLVVAVH